jgi:Uncharacterised nucleotidyltransferase
MTKRSSPSALQKEPGATTSQRQAEFQLIVACSRVGDLLRRSEMIKAQLLQEIDWARVLILAEHHGVFPLLCQGLDEAVAGSIPANICDKLRLRSEQNARKNLRLAAELLQILDCLEEAGVLAIPHKGPVLAESIYGDLGLRDFWDLDILIRRADVPRARQALARISYFSNLTLTTAEENAYLACGYEYPFYGLAGRSLLELQWNLVPRYFAVDIEMEQLFRRASTTSLAGRSVRTLCSEDLVLALSVHAAKHLWTRLCWLRDLGGVIETRSLDWDQVNAEATKHGIRRILAINLMLAQRILGAPIPRAVSETWQKDSETLSICNEIEQRTPAAEPYNTESLRYFRWMIRLREYPLDRARFLGRLAFTPGIGEWSIITLPSSLFPLYRIIRIFRLAARIVNLSDNSSDW